MGRTSKAYSGDWGVTEEGKEAIQENRCLIKNFRKGAARKRQMLGDLLLVFLGCIINYH